MTTPNELDANNLLYPLITIGDVHGQVDLLDRLLTRLQALPIYDKATLVFLGDLVDRGVDPKGAVQRVHDLVKAKKAVCIMGNHDYALVQAAGLGGAASSHWQERYVHEYDSHSTFRSYLGRTCRARRAAYDLNALRNSMPDGHAEFLAGLPWVAQAAGHLFVHCGLSDLILLSAEKQVQCLEKKEWDWRKVRSDASSYGYHPNPHYPAWLGADRGSSAAPLPCPGKIQVTGHQMVVRPDTNSVRIRIDTTGGRFAPLTAAILESKTAPVRFVQSGPGSRPAQQARGRKADKKPAWMFPQW